MEDIFEIKGDGGEKIAYQLLASYSDSVVGNITFSILPFSGRINFNDALVDFLDFYKSLKNLYDSLKGSAEFGTIEGQFQIALEANTRGHIYARGFLSEPIHLNRLTYSFEMDQSYLPPLIEQVEELVKKYPQYCLPALIKKKS